METISRNAPLWPNSRRVQKTLEWRWRNFAGRRSRWDSPTGHGDHGSPIAKKQSKLQQQQTKDSLKKLIEDTKKQLDKVAVVNMEPISISSFESPLFIPFLKIN